MKSASRSWLMAAALAIGWGTLAVAVTSEPTPAMASTFQEQPSPLELEPELRNRLWIDVLAMMLGAFLGALGILAVLISFTQWRPYGPFLASFGAFCALYAELSHRLDDLGE
jgi:hypothetical protein